MASSVQRRVRPPKGSVRIKTECLDIRLEASERQSYQEAAERAGLEISEWVRERLRAAAATELERAGHPVAVPAKSMGAKHRDSAKMPNRLLRTLPSDSQHRLDSLMAKNNEGSISAPQLRELARLVRETEELAVENATRLLSQQ